MKVQNLRPVVFCGLLLALSASSPAQEGLREVSLEQALAAPPEVLANGYLSVKGVALAAELAKKGATVKTQLDGPSLEITKDNVDTYLPALQRRLKIYEDAIRKRGFEQLSRAYTAVASPECERMGLLPGPSLIEQAGFEVELSQNGLIHKGVIIESVVAFEHAMNPEITLMGRVTASRITCDVVLSGFTATSQTAGCSLVLKRAKDTDRAFSEAFLGRAIALSGRAEYGRALVDADQAIKLDADFALAFAIRSQILSSSPIAEFRDGRRAVEDATRACELTEWKQWQCLPPLAAAYAEQGDFDNAIKWSNKAIELAPQSQHRDIKHVLEHYRTGRPLRFDTTFSGDDDQDGSPFEAPGFDDIEATPGVSLEVVFQSESGLEIEGRAMEFVVKGLQEKQKFEFWLQRLVDAPIKLSQDYFTIDEQGKVFAIVNESETACVQLTMRAMMAGEPIKFWIVSADGATRAKVSVIPFPLEIRDDKSGYKVAAELVSPTGVYSLVFGGLNEGEVVESIVFSDGRETSRHKETFEGTPRVWLFDPRIYGADGGTAAVTIIGERGKLSIDLPWGNKMKVNAPL